MILLTVVLLLQICNIHACGVPDPCGLGRINYMTTNEFAHAVNQLNMTHMCIFDEQSLGLISLFGEADTDSEDFEMLLDFGHPRHPVWAADIQPENHMSYDDADLFNCSELTEQMLINKGIVDVACDDDESRGTIEGVDKGSEMSATRQDRRVLSPVIWEQ